MGRSMDVVDSRPLQHRESRFWASNPKFPFVHEQTTPAALRTDDRNNTPSDYPPCNYSRNDDDDDDDDDELNIDPPTPCQ